ncbi:hypothetical protein [Micromonospora andamanensis]|uniref:hypothetical protein n=1 Tax=Micromonospora andamanensis TaxID=1287068 RepID=UPI00362A7DC7
MAEPPQLPRRRLFPAAAEAWCAANGASVAHPTNWFDGAPNVWLALFRLLVEFVVSGDASDLQLPFSVRAEELSEPCRRL